MKKTSAKPKRSSPNSSHRELLYKLKPGIMHREVEGQILILTPREEFLYTVNDSGKMLWQLLVKGATEKKLAAALVKEYGLGEKDALRDVKMFLQTLRAKGILARQ
jgi:hypothetical protein